MPRTWSRRNISSRWARPTATATKQPAHRPRTLNIQEEGGITRTVEAAARAVYELMPEANSWMRTEQPASKICLAMECGGSDGNSGVTANPALGVAADLLVAQGGTAILGETTEIYGAEHLLTRRAVSREVGQKLVDRIKWWEWYTGRLRRQDRQQPVAGQQGRRTDDDLRKIAGCPGQGRLDRPGRRRPVRRPGRHARPGLHGHARLRPSVHHRAGRRRGQRPGLHHGPRQRAGPQADAVHQGGDQHADVRADDRRHGPGRRPDPRRRAGRERRPPALRSDPRRGQRQRDQERAAGVGEEEFAPWTIGPTL